MLLEIFHLSYLYILHFEFSPQMLSESEREIFVMIFCFLNFFVRFLTFSLWNILVNEIRILEEKENL